MTNKLTEQEPYKQGSAACQNYSGLTMRVRTVAQLIAAAPLAAPFATNVNDNGPAFLALGVVLALIAASLCLVDWHYQSAFTAIRDSLAMMEAQDGIKGPWRAHLKRRTHARDHVASYVPFVLLGFVASASVTLAVRTEAWSVFVWLPLLLALLWFFHLARSAAARGRDLDDEINDLVRKDLADE